MINIEQIKSEIESVHKEFLNKYSASVEKVFADQKLAMELVSVKIKYIINAFIEKKIIDHYKELNYTGVKAISLEKNSTNNHVEIITDGDEICVKGFDSLDNFMRPDSNRIWFDEDWSENFDWNEFSKQILMMIHEYVYSRRKAFDVKLDGLFKDFKEP